MTNDPTGFIYFARFFDARVRYKEFKPQFVDKDNHYRRRYEEANKYGLALKGEEIETIEILQSFRLKKELNELSDKQFTRIKDAIEYLSSLPDINNRVNSLIQRSDYFQIKNVNLDMELLEGRWDRIENPK